MEYAEIAHLVKIGGTIFFFLFFAAIIVFVFWRQNAKTPLGAALPALGFFVGITASFFIAAKLGSTAFLIFCLILIGVFVYSLRFFKSVDDERFGDIANLPLEDESLIVEQL